MDTTQETTLQIINGRLTAERLARLLNESDGWFTAMSSYLSGMSYVVNIKTKPRRVFRVVVTPTGVGKWVLAVQHEAVPEDWSTDFTVHVRQHFIDEVLGVLVSGLANYQPNDEEYQPGITGLPG